MRNTPKYLSIGERGSVLINVLVAVAIGAIVVGVAAVSTKNLTMASTEGRRANDLASIRHLFETSVSCDETAKAAALAPPGSAYRVLDKTKRTLAVSTGTKIGPWTVVPRNNGAGGIDLYAARPKAGFPINVADVTPSHFEKNIINPSKIDNWQSVFPVAAPLCQSYAAASAGTYCKVTYGYGGYIAFTAQGPDWCAGVTNRGTTGGYAWDTFRVQTSFKITAVNQSPSVAWAFPGAGGLNCLLYGYKETETTAILQGTAMSMVTTGYCPGMFMILGTTND